MNKESLTWKIETFASVAAFFLIMRGFLAIFVSPNLAKNVKKFLTNISIDKPVIIY